jgi:hypothetical protein
VTKIPALATALLALLALAAAACTKETTNNVLPSEPKAVTLAIDGQCRADGARIVCEDNSASTPAGQLAGIAFQLRSSRTGIAVETRSASPSSTPPRETAFAGVAPGLYEVTHQVTGTDGRSVQKIYSGLQVF